MTGGVPQGPDTMERHVRRDPKAGTTRRMHCYMRCGRHSAGNGSENSRTVHR